MQGDIYRAIADPSRRRILDMLATGDRTVTALMEPFDMSQPAISKHLRVLREAGLVVERKVGRHRHYSLSPEPLREIATWLGHYRKFWRTRLTAFARLLDEEDP
jgi:DNA-binding transcriptional ArsR family regulator